MVGTQRANATQCKLKQTESGLTMLHLFRCASISWFEVVSITEVSESVIDTFFGFLVNQVIQLM